MNKNFNNIFQREELLIGKEKLAKLQQKTVAVFGIGGVGSYVVEGLVRAGISKFILVDFDTIDETNINRQILATTKTIGKYKVDLAEERIKEINPNAKVQTFKEFIAKDNEQRGKEETIGDENNINLELFEKLKSVDYIVDAIDTVYAKIRLIEFANNNNIPIISALGTGNKLDPTKLKLSDISKTKICPLAKVIRKELRKKNITKLDVVYSEELPIKIDTDAKLQNNKVIGSISYVPSIAGLLIVYKVITEFYEKQ